MSGMVGIVNLDDAPVDPRLLARMTKFLAFRGPDAQHVWVDGHVGFGHTLLRTTYESEREHQPLTLDGKVWIVADARVDARTDLIAKLKAHGLEVTPGVPDVELILQAYCVWQEECIQHLLGDFAFAIWDGWQQRLFLARDHMGVKPLYYSYIGSCVIFSNTLDCIRQHPSVSERLNDLAVADFLLFDLNQDKAATTFADIQRIPPAHSAKWSHDSGSLQLHRYWTVPIEEPVYYRRLDDYVDRFNQLLKAAVGDRLRIDRVGIFMSGGLDSPTLAASANDLLRERSGNSRVFAFTNTYDGYDEERYYAGLVAESLGISIEFRGWSPEMADPEWCGTSFHTPEPVPYPNYLAAGWAHNRHVASHSRVVFFGEGPDNALRYEWQPYISHLARRRRFGRLFYDICCHALLHNRIPLLPGLPRFLKRVTEAEGPWFPDWLNPDFESRLQLRNRWEQLQASQSFPHPIRPLGYSSFEIPLWQGVFEGFDPANTLSPMEMRYPFLDIRLLRYLLAVPALPWCRTKYLLRRAMRGRLPKPVLGRPKSPLVRDRWVECVVEYGTPPLFPARGLHLYVDIDRVLRAPVADRSQFWIGFRARALNYWLQNLNQERHNNDSTARGCDEEDLLSESNRSGTREALHNKQKTVQQAAVADIR